MAKPVLRISLRDIASGVFFFFVVYIWVLTPPQLSRPFAGSDTARGRVHHPPRHQQHHRGGSGSSSSVSLISLTPSDLTIYVVYHERVYEKMYGRLNSTQFWPLFKFVAVNPMIRKKPMPKTLFGRNNNINNNNNNNNPVIREWKLPGYNPNLAELKEYSVMMSMYRSTLYTTGSSKQQMKKSAAATSPHTLPRFVGFAQYDMKFDVSVFRRVQEALSATTTPSGGCIFYASTHPARFLFSSGDSNTDGDDTHVGTQLTSSYNRVHGTSYELADLPDQVIIDAIVLPREVFVRMVKWLEAVVAEVLTAPYNNNKFDLTRFESPGSRLTPSELAERAVAMFLGFEQIAGTYELVQLPIRHEHVRGPKG
eukprot:PhM_4_TR7512/c0_g1_i1/m.31553